MSAGGPIQLTDAQRLAWLRLIRSENIGPATFRELLNHFGSAGTALEELPKLSRRGGATRRLRIATLDEAERELQRTRDAGADIVALGEAAYPEHLARIDAPPPLLTLRGNGPGLARRPTVAIVGARNASVAGRKMAERIASGLEASGYVVVSGLARGIDAAAHGAALRGGTVGVIAGGIDHVYPEENRDLYARIVASGGAILTEMPHGWMPRAQDFPRRNRLISGMSLGVVVIEAAERSGSLHTARFALDQGREVMAVPGSPLDPRSAGTNSLIRAGAVLIRSEADVIEALTPMIGRAMPVSRSERTAIREGGPAAGEDADIREAERAIVTEALGPSPVEIDEIIRMTGLPASSVQLILIELEIAGRLERHGNGRLVSLQ
ncbi:DNA protecting protein DprA [Hartmannibacter diazotrophicus]|uniref:DNA protecting protein DprA n=1 Tax=Hartmannibacter diazotrophicus TaxID=1482074 RepID=A0A2C9DA39_9HYPH|nr:DNA-processing protein DprA [Hartmannibacter diazotrophicus]SON56465.1 DNA protecting protein DprA [Hartmannibacter diazotrophicus]